ncbi:hypothetical protein BC628DRAFT_215002 [Trametes gibbosa]|nr:hypothetical protein BC628DRAFT_215002 [Trametes gibbosa]
MEEQVRFCRRWQVDGEVQRTSASASAVPQRTCSVRFAVHGSAWSDSWHAQHAYVFFSMSRGRSGRSAWPSLVRGRAQEERPIEGAESDWRMAGIGIVEKPSSSAVLRLSPGRPPSCSTSSSSPLSLSPRPASSRTADAERPCRSPWTRPSTIPTSSTTPTRPSHNISLTPSRPRPIPRR